MKYLFEHGHSPHLAAKELANVLACLGTKYKKVSSPENLTILDTKAQLNLVEMVDILGGTIRAAKLFKRISQEKLDSHLLSSIHSLANDISKYKIEGKITFSISSASKNIDIKTISIQLKKDLVELGHSSRFLESEVGKMLQPIAWDTEVLEFIFIPDLKTKQWDIFLTENVTNVRSWQFRDRHRPQVDAQSGVLPPKVARMLINLAKKKNNQEALNLLDPFCGSGTVLMEGLLMNFNCFGIDNSPQAISDTEKNLLWVKEEFKLNKQFNLQLADSSAISPEELGWEKMDLIVGEGYLGPSRFSFDQIPTIMVELLNLYQKTFANLKNWLKKDGRIVLALPFFSHPQNHDFQKKLIDTCRDSGYNLMVSPVIYGQPKARVKRAIFILELN